MRTTRDEYKNGKLYNGFNYETQKWTIRGIEYNTADEAYNAIKKNNKNMKICECCGKSYDYITEPQEVKEGGTHICPECWDRED